MLLTQPVANGQEVRESRASILPVVSEKAQNAIVAAIESVLVVAQCLAAQFETVPAVMEAQIVAVLKIVVRGVAVVGATTDAGVTVAQIDRAQPHYRLAAANSELGVPVRSD